MVNRQKLVVIRSKNPERELSEKSHYQFQYVNYIRLFFSVELKIVN